VFKLDVTVSNFVLGQRIEIESKKRDESAVSKRKTGIMSNS
jgi:hypothetical protein